ncbi:MAG: hypothetical protein ACOYD7_01920 [Raoultibacter sp.]|jgi:hypothetical protein
MNFLRKSHLREASCSSGQLSSEDLIPKNTAKALTHTSLTFFIVTCLLMSLIGLTYAWLTTTTNTQDNPFVAKEAQLVILESFDGGITDNESSGTIAGVELGLSTKMVAFLFPRRGQTQQ